MTKKKEYILLFFLALVAYAAILPVRGYSFKMATGLHCASFFALTLWVLWKYDSQLNPWGIILTLVLPWLPDLAFRPIPTSSSLISSVTSFSMAAWNLPSANWHHWICKTREKA